MTYNRNSDESILHYLKKNVSDYNTGETISEFEDPYGIGSVIKEIFERVAADGLAEHELFRPVAEEMAKLSGDNIDNVDVIVNALASVLTDNPWKVIVAGKKVDPLKYTT